MIHSAEELKEKLKHFEYESPEPISKVPSVALRQAVADVRKVVAAGATIDMAHWGQINGQCAVCCAGAVLLARGYYGKLAAVAFRVRDIDLDVVPDDTLTSDSRTIDLRPITDANAEVRDIANAFNGARHGVFGSLLRRGGLNRATANAISWRIARLGCRRYDGQLDAEAIEALCTQLNAVADFLEKEGY